MNSLSMGLHSGGLVLSVLAASSVFASTGTSVWKSETGGAWNVAENWEDGVIPGSDATVTNVIDFSNLASGAVVTNNYKKALPIAGLKFSGVAGDTWSLVNGMGAGTTPFVFATGSSVEVVGGTLKAGWNISPWSATIGKTGSGTWAVSADSWNKVLIRVDEGTIELPKGTSMYQTRIKLNGANTTLKVADAATVPICHLETSGAENQRLVTGDGSCTFLGAGYEISKSTSAYDTALNSSAMAGTGTVAPVNFSTLRITSDQSAFMGTYQVMNGTTTVCGPMREEYAAFYRFEGKLAADLRADASRNGNNLSCWRTPTLYDDPERGKVVKFVQMKKTGTQDTTQQLFGSNGSYTIANAPSGDESFTIGLWLKVVVEEGTSSNDTEAIFGYGRGKDLPGNGTGAFLRLQRNGVGGGHLMFTNWGNNTYFGQTNLVNGTWHHLGFVNGANGKVSIYVDGVKIKENTELTQRAIPEATILELGFAGSSFGNGYHFNGCIDDFIIVRGEVDPATLMNIDDTRFAQMVEPVALNSAAKIDGALGGSLTLVGNQTVGGLTGTGSFAEIKATGDLTVTKETGDDVFRSRLTGACNLVKDGNASLTLAAPLENTGNVQVKGGTLDLRGDGVWSGLVSEWAFEDSANPGADTSGYGFNLSPLGAATAEVVTDETRGKVLHLTGTGALSSAAYPSIFPRGKEPFSFTLWLKTAQLQDKGFLCWGVDVANQRTLCRMDTSGGVMITHRGSGNGGNWVAGSGLQDGNWHHVAYTYDGANRTIYFDGEKAGTKAYSALNITLTDAMYLGYNPLGKTYFNGWLDDVRLYNYALTDAEVAKERGNLLGAGTYELDSPLVPQPVLKYDFEDVANVGKASVAGNDLAVSGAATSVEDAARGGRVLDLTDAAGGWLQIAEGGAFPSAAPVANSKTMDVTIAAWVKPSGLAALTESSKYLAGIVDYGAATNYHMLAFYNEHRKALIGEVNSWGMSRRTYLDLIGGGQADTWHHVAFVRDNVAYSIKVYFDGSLVGEITNSSYKWAGCGTDFFYIGRTHKNATQWFKGYIDDVEIYNVSLSPEQIADLSLRGSGRLAQKNRLPRNKNLSVASGATVRLLGTEESVATLSGAGTVQVAANGKLTVADGSGFTGQLVSFGRVSVPEDVDVANGAAILKDVTGTVTLPANGTVTFSGKASDVASGRYELVTASKVEAPNGISGWTATAESGTLRYEFLLEEGRFILRVRPASLLVIVR